MSKQLGVMGLGVLVLVLALVAGVAVLGATRNRPPSAASTTGLPTATRATVQRAAAAPTETPAAPETLVVRDTGVAGISLRRAPGDGERITIWFDGTELNPLRGEQVAAGRTWKQVRDPQGNEGWMAAEFLAPRAGTATAPPVV